MIKWEEKDSKLQKLFVFNDFKEALKFVNKVGNLAEKVQHHPDIRLQNYKEVFIISTTHDLGGCVTEKDYKLTVAIDSLL